MQCFGAHKLCFFRYLQLVGLNWPFLSTVSVSLSSFSLSSYCQEADCDAGASGDKQILLRLDFDNEKQESDKRNTKKNFQKYAMIDVWTSNYNKDVFEVAWILHCNPAIDMPHIWESWSPCFLSVLLSELLLYEEFESKAFTGDTRNSVCHFAPVVDKLSRDLSGTKGHRDLIARSTWIMKNREHSTLISKFTKK